MVNEARKGTQVINNGIIHDGEDIPDPSYLIEASRSLQRIGASPVIALETPNTEYTRDKLQAFMSNSEISGEEFINDLYGKADDNDNEAYYHNPRIYKLLEDARRYRIPVAFIDGDRDKISENFKDGDYSYSRDDAMFDNVRKLTDDGHTVLTLLGLAHTTELTEGSSDLEKIENEDPTFKKNIRKLYLDFDGFDQAFRI